MIFWRLYCFVKSRPWPSQSASLSESPRKSSSDSELFSLSESSCRYCDQEIMLGSSCGDPCAMVFDYGTGLLALARRGKIQRRKKRSARKSQKLVKKSRAKPWDFENGSFLASSLFLI